MVLGAALAGALGRCEDADVSETNKNTRSYTELPGLAEIVLEESYVLRVVVRPGEVTFEIEFALTTEHPAYSPPPPSETECFRRGSLRLVGIERLLWDGQGLPPAIDASGERDYGHIDSFEWGDGNYLLYGDFGRIDATGRQVEVVVSLST